MKIDHSPWVYAARRTPGLSQFVKTPLAQVQQQQQLRASQHTEQRPEDRRYWSQRRTQRRTTAMTAPRAQSAAGGSA